VGQVLHFIVYVVASINSKVQGFKFGVAY